MTWPSFNCVVIYITNSVTLVEQNFYSPVSKIHFSLPWNISDAFVNKDFIVIIIIIIIIIIIKVY